MPRILDFDDGFETSTPSTSETAVSLTGTQTLTNKTLTSPVINSPTGIVKGDVGLGNVDNTSDASKPVSTAQQTALNLKADVASPTFTGTVAGITASMVGLSNVDNTSDASKPVSTAQATAISAKMTNPMTTGGDVIFGGASGVPTRLANGSAGQFLKSNGTTLAPTWANAAAAAQVTASQTGSRALATNYTNSSSQTRFVFVTLNASATNNYMTITVNGVAFASGQAYAGAYFSFMFAVGAGEVYRVENAVGSNAIVSWVETN